MELVQENYEPLLKRKSFFFKTTTNDKTPTRADIRTRIIKQMKVDDNLLVLRCVNSSFGDKNISISAYVYDDKTSLEKLTPKHLLKRNLFISKEDEGKEKESKGVKK